MRQFDGATGDPNNFGWGDRREPESYFPPFQTFSFASEAEADAYLQNLLQPYFHLLPQVELQHLAAKNKPKIDYLARPLPGADFPFRWFGIEVKKSVSGGDYNRALKQAINYTECAVIDERAPKINGQRIENVYLFPGLPDNHGAAGFTPFWLNRFVGLFHVGLIYAKRDRWGTDYPYFMCSSDRQWSAERGAITRKHNIRNLIASGVPRR